jgi:hypothetical protein
MTNHLSNESPDYWNVRISPKQPQVMDDYSELVETVRATGEGLWDRDCKNKIKEGDYLGFIVGPTNERLPQWASSTPYTRGNGTNSVSDRQAIVLTNNHSIEKTYDWREFRRITGLGKDCSSWMPRGTQKVLNRETLPFILPPPDEVILLTRSK